MGRKLFFSKSFKSLEEFTHDIKAWDFDARKLDRGEFYGRLSSINFEEVQLTEYKFNGIIDQQGTLIKDYTCFSIPINPYHRFYWYNKCVDGNYLLKFPLSRELSALTSNIFHTYTVRISNQYLQQLLDYYEFNNTAKWLKETSEYPINVGVKNNQCLSQYITNLFNLINENPNNLYSESFSYAMKLMLPYSLLELIEKHENQKVSWESSNHDSVINNCLLYINSNITKKLNVNQLLDEANVSKKTLENIFNKRFGLSPYKYIKRTKLNLIKRNLSSSTCNKSVSEIAKQFNFNHLGQFSADYHQLFNEYPSHTRAKKNKLNI